MAKKVSKMNQFRRSKNARLLMIGALFVVLGILYFVFEKFRIWILALMVVLLGAFGMEMTGNDYDVQKLVETGSFAESKLDQTSDGTWIYSDDCGKEMFNCSNFSTQAEAQELFESCGGLNEDVHGLDRDKDGIVCEALPKGEKKSASVETDTAVVTDESSIESDTDVTVTTDDVVDSVLDVLDTTVEAEVEVQ